MSRAAPMGISPQLPVSNSVLQKQGPGAGAHDAEVGEPPQGELGAAAHGAVPDVAEVAAGAEVVRDCDTEVEVEHRVPPPRRDEDDLPRVLNGVERLRRDPARLLRAGPHMLKPCGAVSWHPLWPHHLLLLRCLSALS